MAACTCIRCHPAWERNDVLDNTISCSIITTDDSLLSLRLIAKQQINSGPDLGPPTNRGPPTKSFQFLPFLSQIRLSVVCNARALYSTG